MRGRVVTVRKNGNSLNINLPRDVVRELGVRAGDPLWLVLKPGLAIIAKLAVDELNKALDEQATQKAETS